MEEFTIEHRRRNSVCSDVSSAQSLDPPPAFKCKGNRPVCKRSPHDATCINPGPPALYQLHTEREYFYGTGVRRWTYGQIDRNKQNKVILLVGETGAGKTTIVNTMLNYLLGVKFEDQKFYQITEESKHEDQTKSQTSEIIVYEVFVKENPTSLTIIDTPGYIDNKEFNREKEVSDYLNRLFSHEDGIHYINAVCFVMKASQSQLSGKEHWIFDSVLSLFGRDIEDNIVFIITHSDGGPPTDALNAIDTAKIQCRRDERKQPVHFLFNNGNKSSWEMVEKSMERFLKLLLENNRKSLQMTFDVPKERKQLEACAFNLKDRITEKELKIKELIEILEAVRQNKDKFTVNQAVKNMVEIQNASFYERQVTWCSFCEENCHQLGCWWVSTEDVSKCDVMKDNRCTVCTRKCHLMEHKKDGRKYVIETKRVDMSFDELKQKYGSTGGLPKQFSGCSQHKDGTAKEHVKDEKESQNKTEIEEKLNRHLMKVKKEKSILLREAYMIIQSLSKIRVETDWYFTPEHLDFFISKLAEESEDKMVKELKDVKKKLEDQKNTLDGQPWQKIKNSPIGSVVGSVVDNVGGPLLDGVAKFFRSGNRRF